MVNIENLEFQEISKLPATEDDSKAFAVVSNEDGGSNTAKRYPLSKKADKEYVSVVEQKVNSLNNKITKDKGYFSTEAALLAAYPIPIPGNYANVAGIMYECQVRGTWVNTGNAAPTPELELGEYAKIDVYNYLPTSESGGESEPVNLGAWVQGTVSAGVESDSTTRIRTAYVIVKGTLEIVLIAGYACFLIEYSTSTTSGYIKTTSLTESGEVVLDATTQYIRVVLRKIDNSAIVPSAGSNISIKVKTGAYIKAASEISVTELSVTTSETVDQLDEKIKGIIPYLATIGDGEPEEVTVDTVWELGGINTANSQELDTNTRIRTPYTVIPTLRAITIKANTGYSCNFMEFSSQGTAGYIKFTNIDGRTSAAQATITPTSPTAYFRIAAAKVGDAVMTPSEGSNITVTYMTEGEVLAKAASEISVTELKDNLDILINSDRFKSKIYQYTIGAFKKESLDWSDRFTRKVLTESNIDRSFPYVVAKGPKLLLMYFSRADHNVNSWSGLRVMRTSSDFGQTFSGEVVIPDGVNITGGYRVRQGANQDTVLAVEVFLDRSQVSGYFERARPVKGKFDDIFNSGGLSGMTANAFLVIPPVAGVTQSQPNVSSKILEHKGVLYMCGYDNQQNATIANSRSFLAKSTDYGVTWEYVSSIDKNNAGECSIVFKGERLIMVSRFGSFANNPANNEYNYISYSDDYGITWTTKQMTGYMVHNPQLFIWDNSIYLMGRLFLPDRNCLGVLVIDDDLEVTNTLVLDYDMNSSPSYHQDFIIIGEYLRIFSHKYTDAARSKSYIFTIDLPLVELSRLKENL